MDDIKKYIPLGVKLASKSVPLLLLFLLTDLDSSIVLLFPGLSKTWIYTLLNFGLTLISASFFLTLPLFLLKKKRNEQLSFIYILETLIKNIKRFLPVMLLVIFIIFVLVISFFAYITLVANQTILPIRFGEYNTNWKLLWLPFVFVLNFFTFHHFFFSIEKVGFFRSFIKGFRYGVKNFKIILFNFLISGLSFLFFLYLPFPDQIYRQLITIVVASFISFVLTAINLFYYLDHKD